MYGKGGVTGLCQGGTVRCCEKAACSELPKPKPSVSLEPLGRIFYKSIQVVCSSFTSGEYPLLPPCLQLLFLPCLRATNFFCNFSPTFLQEHLLNYLRISGCHSPWEHAPCSSPQIRLAEEHCRFCRSRREEGSLPLK